MRNPEIKDQNYTLFSDGMYLHYCIVLLEIKDIFPVYFFMIRCVKIRQTETSVFSSPVSLCLLTRIRTNVSCQVFFDLTHFTCNHASHESCPMA